MSYKVWTPVDGVTRAALVYNMSRCGTVYCSPCAHPLFKIEDGDII